MFSIINDNNTNQKKYKITAKRTYFFINCINIKAIIYYKSRNSFKLIKSKETNVFLLE